MYISIIIIYNPYHLRKIAPHISKYKKNRNEQIYKIDIYGELSCINITCEEKSRHINMQWRGGRTLDGIRVWKTAGPCMQPSTLDSTYLLACVRLQQCHLPHVGKGMVPFIETHQCGFHHHRWDVVETMCM